MTMGRRAFARLPVAPCSKFTPVGLGGSPLFTPLHGVMVSRYRGGGAVRRSPRRVGLQPTIGHQVVEVRFLLPRPASPRLAGPVSRERITPALLMKLDQRVGNRSA